MQVTLVFTKRPQTFRSLDFTPLIFSYLNTSRWKYKSFLITSFSYSSRPSSVGFTCTLEYLLSLRFYFLKLHKSYTCTSSLYCLRFSTEKSFFKGLVSSSLGFRLNMGRNHRFLYPPFFFSLPYPYGCPPTPVDLYFIFASVVPLFESLKHFLFRSFTLYLYYSRYFSFVKGFLKNFFQKNE